MLSKRAPVFPIGNYVPSNPNQRPQAPQIQRQPATISLQRSRNSTNLFDAAPPRRPTHHDSARTRQRQLSTRPEIRLPPSTRMASRHDVSVVLRLRDRGLAGQTRPTAASMPPPDMTTLPPPSENCSRRSPCPAASPVDTAADTVCNDEIEIKTTPRPRRGRQTIRR
jgi:hypothetical protein